MNPASSRLKPRPDTLLLGLIALSVLVRLWGIADRLPDPTLGVDPIVANTAVRSSGTRGTTPPGCFSSRGSSTS